MAIPATYDEFLDFAKDAARVIAPDAEIKTQKVDKLQGESYVGISVRPENSNAAVTMNLHNLFDKVRENPKRLAAVMSEFLSALDEAIRNIPKIDADRLMDYEQVKSQLVMQVIPVGPNRERLSQIPHKTIEDIAVVYRIDVSDDRHQNASSLVTNNMLECFGVTPEQLHRDAVASQVDHCPPTLRNMSEVLAEMTGSSDFLDMPESPLWVASVEGGIHGAAAVQVPEFMDQAAEKLGGDFFVLPSSIHECLFVPDNGELRRPQLEEMVRSVNADEVSEADFLSDSVYHYDADARIFEKAATFESRVMEQAVAYETSAPASPSENSVEVQKDTITVLLVEPERYPRPVEIGTELKDLQEAVGGFIETSYPFADKACLILNDTGKIEGLPLNRALRDDDGTIYDVVAGSFLVAGLAGDSFGSLTPEQMTKYEQQFHQPEMFIHMGKGIMALPMPDDTVEMLKERARAAEKSAGKNGPEKKADTPEKKQHKKRQKEAR